MVQGYFALENDSLLGLMQKKKKKLPATVWLQTAVCFASGMCPVWFPTRKRQYENDSSSNLQIKEEMEQ